MIGKIPKPRKDGRSSFKDLINYCLGVTGHSEGAVLYAGKQNVNDFKTAAIEMESLAIESVRCKTPAFHFILSWRSHESPTNEQVDRKYCADGIKFAGLSSSLGLAVRHG